MKSDRLSLLLMTWLPKTLKICSAFLDQPIALSLEKTAVSKPLSLTPLTPPDTSQNGVVPDLAATNHLPVFMLPWGSV